MRFSVSPAMERKQPRGRLRHLLLPTHLSYFLVVSIAGSFNLGLFEVELDYEMKLKLRFCKKTHNHFVFWVVLGECETAGLAILLLVGCAVIGHSPRGTQPGGMAPGGMAPGGTAPGLSPSFVPPAHQTPRLDAALPTSAVAVAAGLAPLALAPEASVWVSMKSQIWNLFETQHFVVVK